MSNMQEIIRYLIFGVGTTVVNWLVYTLCVTLLHLDITLSNAIAWVVSVLFAFVTNKLWVFQSDSKNKDLIKEIALFFSARMATGVLEIFLPSILVSIGLNQSLFGIPGFAAKMTVTVLVIILNYIFSKKVVFKAKTSH